MDTMKAMDTKLHYLLENYGDLYETSYKLQSNHIWGLKKNLTKKSITDYFHNK